MSAADLHIATSIFSNSLIYKYVTPPFGLVLSHLQRFTYFRQAY
jgi:hypothetical protein